MTASTGRRAPVSSLSIVMRLFPEQKLYQDRQQPATEISAAGRSDEIQSTRSGRPSAPLPISPFQALAESFNDYHPAAPAYGVPAATPLVVADCRRALRLCDPAGATPLRWSSPTPVPETRVNVARFACTFAAATIRPERAASREVSNFVQSMHVRSKSAPIRRTCCSDHRHGHKQDDRLRRRRPFCRLSDMRRSSRAGTLNFACRAGATAPPGFIRTTKPATRRKKVTSPRCP